VELSSEDALCLNVLLAARVQAVRIDESSMTVQGLTPRGEATVSLHPTCRSDQYLRLVREMLAEHAMGSPGGYPLHLRRWTRMGQLGDDNLARLLLTGEPEAVVAVVHAPGLTDEIAERAWWAMPSAENARRMLERDCVAQGRMGQVLAAYLVEYLPFEEDHNAIVETVRLLLHTGLVDAAARAALWSRGRHKKAYYVGFLELVPDTLPLQLPARRDWEALSAVLEPLAAAGNPYAGALHRLLSGSGQSFLQGCAEALQQPPTQEVANALLNAVGSYVGPLWPIAGKGAGIDELVQAAQNLCDDTSAQPQALRQLLTAAPQLKPEIRAMLVLSQTCEALAEPVFSRSTAVGSLMRKKLEPVVGPLLRQLSILRGMMPG